VGKVVRIYREALKAKGIQRAYDYLLREGAVRRLDYFQDYPTVQHIIRDECVVCGRQVTDVQCLNHFRQVHEKSAEHWAYVTRYYKAMKEVFLEVIENMGYDLVKEDTIYGDAIWVEAARGSHPRMGAYLNKHPTSKNENEEATNHKRIR
jgi:hypothetical protein